jgi:hypothetical protein
MYELLALLLSETASFAITMISSMVFMFLNRYIFVSWLAFLAVLLCVYAILRVVEYFKPSTRHARTSTAFAQRNADQYNLLFLLRNRTQYILWFEAFFFYNISLLSLLILYISFALVLLFTFVFTVWCIPFYVIALRRMLYQCYLKQPTIEYNDKQNFELYVSEAPSFYGIMRYLFLILPSFVGYALAYRTLRTVTTGAQFILRSGESKKDGRPLVLKFKSVAPSVA